MRLRWSRREDSEQMVVERLTKVSALVYALLHDVATWFSRVEGAVDREKFPEYRLGPVAELSSAEQRLATYLNASILAGWKPVVEGWLLRGYGYRPAFGRHLRLVVTEERSKGFRAVVKWKDRSEIELPEGGRCSPAGRWGLEVVIAPDLRSISTVNWIIQPAS
ncbi:MAG: hypothetical protein ACREP9_20110 [Candidatus Dormibacteraceae bacterium]